MIAAVALVLAVAIVGILFDVFVLEPRRWRKGAEYARSLRVNGPAEGLPGASRDVSEALASDPIRDAAE